MTPQGTSYNPGSATPAAVGAGQAVVVANARAGHVAQMNNTMWSYDLAANRHDGSQLAPVALVAGAPKTPYRAIPDNGSWLPTVWANSRVVGAPAPLWRTNGADVAPGSPTPTLVASSIPGPH